MIDFFEQSIFFGVIISLAAYGIGAFIRKKAKVAIANPLLISVLLIVGFLWVFHIDFEVYKKGADYISFFLTPATVSLAIPLYRKLSLLKKYPKSILGGILAGVFTAIGSILAMSFLFGLTHEQYVTLLPKSITTAIAMGVSEKLGGMVSVTVVAISITGIMGNIVAESVLKLFRITDPIAKGLAIGTASHAMGTSKAMEIGEVEGAMSSLSIVIAGILTVITASVFAKFY